MGLLRSEDMWHGVLSIPVHDARKFIDVIGKKTNIQFEDMNASAMRREYRVPIQRIDEMERILRFITEEINKMPSCEIKKNRLNEFFEHENQFTLDGVESELKNLYQQFVKLKENNATLTEQRNHAAEEACVAHVARDMLMHPEESSYNVESFEANAKVPLVSEEMSRTLGQLAGTVLKTDEARFARALWRAARGKIFFQFKPVDEPLIDPKTGLSVAKSVFIIYFQGATGWMRNKVEKVCQAFGVNMYTWPENAAVAQATYSKLSVTVKEKEQTLEAFHKHMQDEINDLLTPFGDNQGANSKIEDWRLFCIKEKSIYSIMNLCTGKLVLNVNVWYPLEQQYDIKKVLEKASEDSEQGAMLLPDREFGTASSTPPTYIRTNEFTEPWQEVVSTYGIPKYQEANPALFTTVTFPFIFGMMYGDVGHGSLVFLAGLYLCWKAESFRYTQPVLCRARYVVLSMGIFATFAGFLYNDMFSLGLQLFESGYERPAGGLGEWKPTYDTKNNGGPGPYPFGLDWAWIGASNELIFVNSLKMKMSVLFGVLQMTMGVLLRWSNAIYERSVVDLVFECVPMLVFMFAFFGWMDFMILYKWVHPVDNPPSIINSLICMAMGQENKMPLWEGTNGGMSSVDWSHWLMLATILSVPLMLIPKPFILLAQHLMKSKDEAHNDEEKAVVGGGEHEEFEFGEILIHQVIETIEYVLGTISHTASYLRIWALSLAHQQLSQVFFNKTLQMGLNMSFPLNGIALYCLFTVWFGITLGVLLGMDVLECFLHTLRLHWVEFQSKFYKQNGELFEPYSIQKIVQRAE